MGKNILSILCIVSALILTACKADNPVSDISASASKEKMSKPELPLDKDTVLKTIDELGLPCVISEDESQESLSREMQYIPTIYCVIRRESTMWRAEMRDEKPFAWEDWKQESIFIPVLYGGFEDEEKTR